MKEKKFVAKEAAFAAALIADSLALTLLTKSDFGISTMSGLPYVLSLLIPNITNGMMNFLFQSFMLVLLMIMTRQPKASYLISFLIGFVYGLLVDVFTALLAGCPVTFGFRILYFITGWLLMCFNVALFINTGFPLMPFDVFVADAARYKKLPLKKVKTAVDLSFVVATLLVSWLGLHAIKGVGVGTIIMALFTGVIEQWFLQKIREKTKMECVSTVGRKLVQMAAIKSAK